MNRKQKRYHQIVAESVVAATGRGIDILVENIENPKILRRILRLETKWMNGHPRLCMKRAIRRRLNELKRLDLRTCEICGCTDHQGCIGGCAWDIGIRDVCTQCARNL